VSLEKLKFPRGAGALWQLNATVYFLLLHLAASLFQDQDT
jgi:hypothetical protein